MIKLDGFGRIGKSTLNLKVLTIKLLMMIVVIEERSNISSVLPQKAISG
jgi:hypothetical protein